MDFCHTIESIDCELAVYRKGFLNIRLDLAKGLIVWKDSNHWSNNFVRSMTFTEVEMIRRLMPDLCAVYTPDCSCPLTGKDNSSRPDIFSAAPDDDTTAVGSSWQILLHSGDECWCIKGRSQQNRIWRKFIRTIEQISRIPVRIQ
ncbi:MAG: hypothetical protein GX028_02310 [Clostridiaceae bacterium]|nr:hypothetical protein [Clostridiaceae bacterium]